mmetsp:Transcript_58679/g.137316  ORF Transcript_58679/g.137316 Transcript_58679/m.137316 type:complete len:325 (+) Transcript_58679:295-1269(+)
MFFIISSAAFIISGSFSICDGSGVPSPPDFIFMLMSIIFCICSGGMFFIMLVMASIISGFSVIFFMRSASGPEPWPMALAAAMADFMAAGSFMRSPILLKSGAAPPPAADCSMRFRSSSGMDESVSMAVFSISGFFETASIRFRAVSLSTPGGKGAEAIIRSMSSGDRFFIISVAWETISGFLEICSMACPTFWPPAPGRPLEGADAPALAATEPEPFLAASSAFCWAVSMASEDTPLPMQSFSTRCNSEAIVLSSGDSFAANLMSATPSASWPRSTRARPRRKSALTLWLLIWSASSHTSTHRAGSLCFKWHMAEFSIKDNRS